MIVLTWSSPPPPPPSCPQGNSIPGVLKFQGLITTFEMIMADCPELRKLHWRCVVIDEAHRLKNRNCKLLEGLKLMNLVSLQPRDQIYSGSLCHCRSEIKVLCFNGEGERWVFV